MIRAFLISVLLLLTLTAPVGCSAAYWGGATEVRDEITVSKSVFGSKLHVFTTKNTQHKLDIDKVTYSQQAGFELQGLHSDYQGDASTVINAQGTRAQNLVAVMHEQVLYQEAIGANIQKAIQAGGQAGAAIIGAATQPLLGATGSLDTPIGKGSVTLGSGQSAPSPTPAPVPTNAVIPSRVLNTSIQ